MQNNDRYHLAIDGMRIFAILAVICIHSTTRVLEASSFDIQKSSVAFFFNQVSRFAVPLFFMISGFVLEINYPFHQSYVAYLKKRLSRILLPYIFWSFVYYYFVYTQHTISFFQAVLNGSSSYQLYFIPTLLIFYILFPFAHTLYRFITNRYMLIILGLIQISLLSEDYYVRPFTFFFPVNIALLNFYIFILGMVAARHHKLLATYAQKWKLLLVFLLGFFALGIFAEGKILYLQTHNYLYFYSQWRPSILLYTLVVFSISYIFCNKLVQYEKIIRRASRLSFFIFFIHVIILELLWNLAGKNIFYATLELPGQQYLYNPVFFITIVSTSYAVAYLVQKVPFMTKISG